MTSFVRVTLLVELLHGVVEPGLCVVADVICLVRVTFLVELCAVTVRTLDHTDVAPEFGTPVLNEADGRPLVGHHTVEFDVIGNGAELPFGGTVELCLRQDETRVVELDRVEYGAVVVETAVKRLELPVVPGALRVELWLVGYGGLLETETVTDTVPVLNLLLV